MSGISEFLSKISGSFQDQYDYINSIEVTNIISDVNKERIKRVVKVSLPFITLYEPAKRPVAIILGTTHAVTSLVSLQKAYHQKDKKIWTKALYQTAFATANAASSIFAPSLGMFLTTEQELVILFDKLEKALKNKNYNKVFLVTTKIINHTLSISLLFSDASHVMIVSLSFQILLGLIQSYNHIKKDKYLEAAGNLVMSAIHGYQLKIEVEIYKLQCAINQHAAECEKELKKITGILEKEILQKTEEYFKNPEVSEKQAPDFDVTLLVGRQPSDEEIINAFLKHYQGFCVGEMHDQESSKAFLINNMDYLKSKNVKVLFAEGWNYTDQKIMDLYFSFQHLRELKSSDRVEVQKLLDFSTYNLMNKLGSPYTSIALLEKTKQSGIRLVGIDYKHDNTPFVAIERAKKMNFVAAQVMEMTRANMKPEEKFVALMGMCHLHTLKENGISVKGVADLTKTPSILFLDYPKKIEKNEFAFSYAKVFFGFPEHRIELPKLNVVLRELII